MTKKRATLTSASVQRLQREAIPHQDPVMTAATASPSPSRRKAATAAAVAESKLPPSRRGKVPINVWTNADNRAELKAYAASKRTTVDELMADALEQLFKRNGLKFRR